MRKKLGAESRGLRCRRVLLSFGHLRRQHSEASGIRNIGPPGEWGIFGREKTIILKLKSFSGSEGADCEAYSALDSHQLNPLRQQVSRAHRKKRLRPEVDAGSSGGLTLLPSRFLGRQDGRSPGSGAAAETVPVLARRRSLAGRRRLRQAG